MRQITPANYYLSVTPLEEMMLRVILRTPNLSTTQVQQQVQAKSYPNISKSLSKMERFGYLNRETHGIYSLWNFNQDSIAHDIIAHDTIANT